MRVLFQLMDGDSALLPHPPLHVKLEAVPLVAELPDGIIVGRPAHVVALLVGVAAADVAAVRAAVDGRGAAAAVGRQGEEGALAAGIGAHEVEGTGEAVVAVDEEDAEGGEVAEGLGDGASEAVAVEHEDDEVVEVAQGIGDGTGQLVLVQIEKEQVGESSEAVGNGTVQVALLEGELGEAGHFADEGGDGIGIELVLAEEKVDQVEMLEVLLKVTGELVVRQIEVGQGRQMLDGAGDGPAERVLVKGKVVKLLLRGGDVGDRASQIIVVQVQDGEVRVVEKGGGDGAAELIVGQVQLVQLLPTGEGRVRQRFGEEVVLQIHVLDGIGVLDVVEVALHLVIVEGEELQVGQLLEAGRDLALDHVVGKDDDAEIGHGVEGVRQRPGDVEVVLQGEDAEVGELLELLGDGAGHVVVGEPDLADGALVGPALAVRAPEVHLLSLGVDLVPLALVLAGEEGEGVEPRVSLGGVVEGGQGVALDELLRLVGAEVLGVGRDRNAEGVLLADPLEGQVLGTAGALKVVLGGDAGRQEEGPGGLLPLGARHLRDGRWGRPRTRRGGGRIRRAGRRRCGRLGAAGRPRLGLGHRNANDEAKQGH